jgi:hypothetical protein
MTHRVGALQDCNFLISFGSDVLKLRTVDDGCLFQAGCSRMCQIVLHAVGQLSPRLSLIPS